jgi:hypothetical protein
MTHIVLARASEDLLRGALQAAWRLRRDANAKTRSPSPSAPKPLRRSKKGRA